ncbi:GNAT family N-acetyltransferase [Paeniglutamicibacter cryotolerans]|uniref:Acyl-CoA synthetase (NDP forming)/RimJ/RimL family protein N-acetyltransferase n=1 Tax=Paeniglutamicibacter cryotolerans TaxID=670079 RepID=A0A839QKE4_9MICC|nr:GNAT family N-acetyltransferase [Paeniglutamicibacter cryotolerans]MBB2996679.1 acyl-CoA synthetase (NDP forming)/RimJ/RimL family protein N-acetyltransferase [Paeniglutamicibacter cryotolerans]
MVDGRKPGEYPAYWEADVVLRNGSTAHLRPIRATDADALQALHRGQSEASVYLRYFTYKSALTAKELKRFTEVDHVDRVAFVVLRGEAIIGVGRYDRLEDRKQAEVAFNISDAYQGMGVGSILLEHLAAAARENGIERFCAEVLPENRKMLTVFAEAGYEVKRHFDEGVVMLEFPIDPTERSRAVMESREHRAEAQSLRELLTASSVAVIGASRAWGSIGYTLLENVIEGGFTGAVYGINPKAFELAGMISYASLAEVPGPVDLAVIAVPQSEITAVINDCAAFGVKGLLVVTGGYEDEGRDGLVRQRELVRLARANGMRMIGPASLGVLNTDPAVRLNASVSPGMPSPGSLGLFSQSAAIGVLLYAASSRRSVGLGTFISAGNRADVSGNDAMQFWEDDPGTSAVGLYLESFGNPRKFSRIARRLSRSKPVIVAKSDVMGLRLPPGHAVRTTQAPLGAVDAMLRQSGVIRVQTNEELMDIAQIVAAQPLPAGDGVAVLTNSVALASVVADAAEQHGLRVIHNVSDIALEDGQSGALPLLATRLAGLLADEAVHSAVICLLPARGISTLALAETIRRCAGSSGKPVVVAFTGITDASVPVEGLLDTELTEAGNQLGLPCYSSPGQAVIALAAVVRYAQWRARDFGEPTLPAGIDSDRAAVLIDAARAKVGGTDLLRLPREQAAALLACYGIQVLESVEFATADQAVAAAGRLGWPVAIKTREANLRHRLDLGGVRLNITDEAVLRSNIEHMRETLAPYGDHELEIQSMAPGGQGCVVRALEDPLLGPLISFGLAGDAVNLLDDWAHGIPPLTNTDLAELVRTPRAAARLFGYQGLPPVDVGLLEDFLNRVARMKDEHPEVSLLEFNPVMASDSGLTVLSAEVWIGNPEQRTDSARRALSS